MKKIMAVLGSVVLAAGLALAGAIPAGAASRGGDTPPPPHTSTGEKPAVTPVTNYATAIYLYHKVDVGESASWENSGYQALIATHPGQDYFVSFPGTLPSGVCGEGWAVQQDTAKYAGDSFAFPPVVERSSNTGVLGWPPIVKATHQELSDLVDVPDCVTVVPIQAGIDHNDPCGPNNLVVNAPEAVEGVAWASSTDSESGRVTVTATALDGFVLSRDGVERVFVVTWEFVDSDEACPVVAPPVTPPSAELAHTGMDDVTGWLVPLGVGLLLLGGAGLLLGRRRVFVGK